MAQLNPLAQFILSFEGGFSNHPADKGGATNMGVTLSTWKKIGYDKDGDEDIDVDDLRLLTKQEVIDRVLRPYYWDKCGGDKIVSQGIANLIVDWAWCSGTTNVIKRVQRIVGTAVDGVVGPMTLNTINNKSSINLFNKIFVTRQQFLLDIVARNPSQRVFLKGWMRRLNNIEFNNLINN